MRVLFVGDPHLKITRFDLAKQFLEWVNGVIAKHKPDLVVNLGDTFDTHAVVRSEVLTEFMNHVNIVKGICPYIYLLGNHDMYKPNDNKYHALKHLKDKIDGFTVIDEVVNLHGMTFVPYVHRAAAFPSETLPICVAHQTFKGETLATSQRKTELMQMALDVVSWSFPVTYINDSDWTEEEYKLFISVVHSLKVLLTLIRQKV